MGLRGRSLADPLRAGVPVNTTLVNTNLVASLTLLAASVPANAYACSVCFDATDQSRGAFLATTIFLSLLPLGLIGGVAYYVLRVMRAGEVAAADEPGSGR